MKLLARKGAAAAILKTLRRTSNYGNSLAPFTSASNDDSKIGSRDETAYGKDDQTSSVAESLKEGAVKAMETGLNVGEKAKESMEEAFDAAMETTKNVKDAVVDDANDTMRKEYDYPRTHSHS